MENKDIAISALGVFIILDVGLIIHKVAINRGKGSPRWPVGTTLLFNDLPMSIKATKWYDKKRIDDIAYFDQWWYQISNDSYDYEYPEELILSLIDSGYIVFD